MANDAHTKPWMIFGAGGTLGSECVSHLSAQGAQVHAFTHADLAIDNPTRVAQAIFDIKPGVIINAAAYNAVDKAESEFDLAYAINASAPLQIALAARRAGAILIHFSTDFVFDGTSDTIYTETSCAQPLSVYAASKWLGEQAVIHAHPSSYALRTAVVFGKQGNNFYTRFQQMASKQTTLSMVDDMIGCPTPASSLARVSVELVTSAAPFGLYHAVGEAHCSRYEFAAAIKKLWNLQVDLKACTSDAFDAPAKRPLKAILANTKLNALGLHIDSWQEGLKAIRDGETTC